MAGTGAVEAVRRSVRVLTGAEAARGRPDGRRAPRDGSGPRPRPLAALGAVAATAAAAVAAAASVRGGEPFTALGLSAPPTWVILAAPVARLATTLAAWTCLGLLAAVVLARPTTGGARELGAHGYRVLRWAGVAAGAWAAAAPAAAVLLVLGGTSGNTDALRDPGAFTTAATALEEPAGLVVAGACALLLAVVCRVALSWRTAAGAAVVAAFAVAASTVTGQVASSGAGHDIATDAAVLAAVAAAVWFGLVLADALDAPGSGPDPLRRAAARSRPVTLVAATVAVAGSAVVESELVRGAWLTSVHGGWALAGLVLLVAAAVATARRARPVVVAAVLVAAAGAAAGAATEPAPALGAPATVHDLLLGYDLDGPPGLLGLLGPGRLDLLHLVVGTVLACAYLAAVRRLRRRGDAWPPGRTAAWLLGCALWVWTTSSGLGAQAMGTFSAHMGAHMLWSMMVPILLVLGGPISLALRALPPARSRRAGAGDPGIDGPREWVRSLSESPAARVLTHPLVALGVFVGSFYALYFSGLFDAALPYHWAHQLMTLHFVLAGYLFFWPVIGVDRGPHPLPHVARLALLLASMPFHAFFGVALLGADGIIGERFYRELALPWVPDLLADQHLAGGIAWAAGEGPLIVVVVALLVQWSRADRREAERSDRRAHRDGDADLAAWNAMLADLARRR